MFVRVCVFVGVCLCFGLQEVAVKNMPLFLRYLTDQMHERVPDSQILWYDSVIENGKLLWQNQLNQSNRWGGHNKLH